MRKNLQSKNLCFIVGLFFFCGFILLSGCAEQLPPLAKTAHPCLGTIVEIMVADKDRPAEEINNAIKKAFGEVERVENLLSRFKSESDISRINADANMRATKVNPETISLLEKSIQFSQLTDGAFDITIHPLMETWGFGEKSKRRIPNAAQLQAAREKVGYQYIKILNQEQSVFLSQPGMSLDLGGIATGYAVDRAIAVLKQEGIKSALVNAGGDIYALGKRGETEKWRVALQHPRKADAFLTVLELQDESVATSGDYQRYIEIDGKHYSHIINPQSGYPCEDIPASVTIIAPNCLTADALATSVFVLGPEKGVDLVKQLTNTEAIVVCAQKDKLDIFLSPGLQGKLKFNSE